MGAIIPINSILGPIVIVHVSYGYRGMYSRVGSINNGTDINTRCVLINSLRKLGGEWANGRDAHKKNFVGAQLPFPFFPLPPSLLLFLLPLFPHLLPATAKESGDLG